MKSSGASIKKQISADWLLRRVVCHLHVVLSRHTSEDFVQPDELEPVHNGSRLFCNYTSSPCSISIMRSISWISIDFFTICKSPSRLMYLRSPTQCLSPSLGQSSRFSDPSLSNPAWLLLSSRQYAM